MSGTAASGTTQRLANVDILRTGFFLPLPPQATTPIPPEGQASPGTPGVDPNELFTLLYIALQASYVRNYYWRCKWPNAGFSIDSDHVNLFDVLKQPMDYYAGPPVYSPGITLEAVGVDQANQFTFCPWVGKVAILRAESGLPYIVGGVALKDIPTPGLITIPDSGTPADRFVVRFQGHI